VQRLDDERAVDEGDEHKIEFVEAAEEAAKALGSSEQPLDLVAASMPGFLEPPRFDAVRMRGDNLNEAQVQRLLPPESAAVDVVAQDIGLRADTLTSWHNEALARLEAVLTTASIAAET